jgi:hypothetical protein
LKKVRRERKGHSMKKNVFRLLGRFMLKSPGGYGKRTFLIFSGLDIWSETEQSQACVRRVKSWTEVLREEQNLSLYNYNTL